MHSFWGNRPLLITILVLAVLVTLMIITAGQDDASGAESLIGGVLEPVQGVFYDVTDGIASFVSGIFTPNDLSKNNEQLKEQVADLKGQVQDYNELKKENERLTSLLNYTKQNSSFKYVTARVTGRSLGQWFVSFSINAGINNGVRKDMAVVNKDGLIGRITKTGANWSNVLAIIDSESAVSGIVERTRDNGIVQGGENGSAELNMQYLPLNADLIPGDKIITSGIGGIFPKGLLIGQIKAVSRSGDSDDMQKSATVNPSVDFLHLEEVMVITDQTKEEK